MTFFKSLAFVCVTLISLMQTAQAQSADPLVFSTVHRPPFAYTDTDEIKGFSIDLMTTIAERMGRTVTFEAQSRFGDMLNQVRTDSVDGAIANISITAEREQVMDFSQPIFGGGIQILLPKESSITQQLFGLINREIITAILVALGLLFVGGMLMWVFERKRQPYFDRPAAEAAFPSFWWALNLVVNGGFEERMPRSALGRLFAVVLVVASLFIVSVFVATITASVTVSALQTNVQSLRDLESRVVGTVAGSTSASFLEENGVQFAGYGNPAVLLEAFGSGDVDAVVFDGPILAYYQQTEGSGRSRLIDKIYRPENYGILLPSGSPLKEDIDQIILTLREDGTYQDILTKWFGSSYFSE